MSNNITTTPTAAEIDEYLANLPASTGAGRLIFGLDATASRQPTWDQATALQAEMFEEGAGGLDIKLVYYRGDDECKASGWISDGRRLSDMMRRITCESGITQIRRVLAHAANERNFSALVFVGDAMEEEPEELYAKARALRAPVFMFQEGDDPDVEKVFRQIAKLTRGAYAKFAPGAAGKLAELLRAVAAYAVGGMEALDAKEVRLIEQMKGDAA
jgi:hypothetical protein